MSKNTNFSKIDILKVFLKHPATRSYYIKLCFSGRGDHYVFIQTGFGGGFGPILAQYGYKHENLKFNVSQIYVSCQTSRELSNALFKYQFPSSYIQFRRQVWFITSPKPSLYLMEHVFQLKYRQQLVEKLEKTLKMSKNGNFSKIDIFKVFLNHPGTRSYYFKL